MIFFTTVVSPSVFASLNNNGSSKFLRTIFPRMFLFGFLISLIGIILTFFSSDFYNSIILSIIALSFIINRNYLTPMINNFRDQELEGNKVAAKKFKVMHLFSVLLFIINFFLLILVIVLNYSNYNL
tara:strand:+ start:243 stop:623 length:381 start_codon:yes stop_codon:yes gene_type:complete